MKISVDIRMYPLDQDYVPPIKAFIRQLRTFPGLDLVTNQLSTQITGEFDNVMRALNTCMGESMAHSGRVVFVARYLNTALEIDRLPRID